MKKLNLSVTPKLRELYTNQLCIAPYECTDDETIRQTILTQMYPGENEQAGMMFWNGHNIIEFLTVEPQKTIKDFMNEHYCIEGKSIRQIMKEALKDGEDPEEILGEFVDIMENYDKIISE
jgi:hypothetical protein